jgi:hypothetical protein
MMMASKEQVEKQQLLLMKRKALKHLNLAIHWLDKMRDLIQQIG